MCGCVFVKCGLFACLLFLLLLLLLLLLFVCVVVCVFLCGVVVCLFVCVCNNKQSMDDMTEQYLKRVQASNNTNDKSTTPVNPESAGNHEPFSS